MKHIVIIVLLTLGLVSLVRAVTAEDMLTDADATLASVNNKTTKLLDVQGDSAASQQGKVGMIFFSGDNLTSARLKRTLADSLDGFANLNVSYSGGDINIQMSMFDKMLAENYSTVIVELIDVDVAEYFINGAKKKGTSLIFTGNKMDLRLLQSYDKVYYIGYDDLYFENIVISELKKIYDKSPEKVNSNSKDSTVDYSAILVSSNADKIVEELGKAYEFYELPAKHKITSKVTQLGYDLEKELDKIIASKTDVIFFDDPVTLKRSIEYFENKEKFKTPPAINAIMLDYDDNVDEFLSYGNVLMAIGYDDAVLAKTTARLTILLAQGKEPNSKLMELEAVDGKYFYINYSVAS